MPPGNIVTIQREFLVKNKKPSSNELGEVEHSGFEPLTPTLPGGYLAVFQV